MLAARPRTPDHRTRFQSVAGKDSHDQTLLILGGTGHLGSALARLAHSQGHTVSVASRTGPRQTHPLPDRIEQLHVDVDDRSTLKAALGGRRFDAVANFVGYTPTSVAADIDYFQTRTRHYLFISTAMVYRRPADELPITELAARANPHSSYARDKIAAEDLLFEATRASGFPATIVRPSATYDRTSLPLPGGCATLHLLRDRHAVPLPFNASNRWPLTHAADLADAVLRVVTTPTTRGAVLNIVNPEPLDWTSIIATLATTVDAPPGPPTRHVTLDAYRSLDQDLGDDLEADFGYSLDVDITRTRQLLPDLNFSIPWTTGVHQVVDWHDRHPELCAPGVALAARMSALETSQGYR